MKTRKHLILSVLLVLLGSSLFSQKFIKTDESLKANSDFMQVKRKGISAIGKYQFGPYQVVSGKAGWTKEINKHGLITDNVKVTVENKKSFVFVGNEKDSVSIQTSLNIFSKMEDKNALVFRKLFGWHDYEVIESKETYISSLLLVKDSTEWNLVLVYPRPMENNEGDYIWDNNTQFFGMLSDSLTQIEIKRVFEQENGKNSMLNPIWGYEFFLDGKSIAALQDFPINKMFVWIRKDLDEDLKIIIAASAASILVRKD